MQILRYNNIMKTKSIIALALAFYLIVTIIIFVNPANGEIVEGIKLHDIVAYESKYIPGDEVTMTSGGVIIEINNKPIVFECRQCYWDFENGKICEISLYQETIKARFKGKMNDFLYLHCAHGEKQLIPE